MQIIDAVFLDALEKGIGKPVMVCALYKWGVDGWSLVDEYEIVEAVLARERYDIFVQENLLASGLVDSVVNSGWAVEVERGLWVNGTKYSLVSNLYYLSYVSYSDHEGRSHLIADLLPTTSIVNIDGEQPAQDVIQEAFDQFNNLATITFDTDRDIWYDFQFFDGGKDLNLIDGRSLTTILQQKYFAYLFPRYFHLIYAYGVASNEGNNVDGTYTPFAHARTMYFLYPDKPVNLTWDNEDGYQEYIDVVTNGVTSLGFIDAASDPFEIPEFQKWTRIFSGNNLQYIQRPDLRLEQGDLLKVSTDEFDKTRCFELIEVFKSKNTRLQQESPAAWYQIVRQLPYHPQYLVTYEIPDDWNWFGLTPPWGGGQQTDPTVLKVMSSSFKGLLSQDASNVQQAFELLDVHNHDSDYAKLHSPNEFTDIQKINTNSSTAFVVEQDGVKENVLVVDTTNGRIGINTSTPTVALDINGSYQCYGDLWMSKSGANIVFKGQGVFSSWNSMFFRAPADKGMTFGDSTAVPIYFGVGGGKINFGAGTAVAKLNIFGDANRQQLLIKAFTTQTANLLEVLDNDGNILFSISPTGVVSGHGYDADYAPITEGVTNGDSHDHAGGDGAQIDYEGLSNLPANVVQVLLNTDTALESGNDAARVRIPAKLNGLNLTAVAASRQSGTGELNIMIRNSIDSQDMLSTALTVDTGETDSLTAATAAVINTSYDDVATGDQIAIDVDDEGTDTLYAIVELTFG